MKLSDHEEDLADQSMSPSMLEAKESPRFAQSNGSLVYKPPSQKYSSKAKKEAPSSKPSLIDKLTQEYSPVKREPRNLNPYEINSMCLSPELRKSLLKQNGYDVNGQPEEQKTKEMIKSEKKAMVRAEREAQVKEFEADAKLRA